LFYLHKNKNRPLCFQNPVTIRGAFAQTQQAVSNCFQSIGTFDAPLALLPAGEIYQMGNWLILRGRDAYSRFLDAWDTLSDAWRR
jgi:hypothetical protein